MLCWPEGKAVSRKRKQERCCGCLEATGRGFGSHGSAGQAEAMRIAANWDVPRVERGRGSGPLRTSRPSLDYVIHHVRCKVTTRPCVFLAWVVVRLPKRPAAVRTGDNGTENLEMMRLRVKDLCFNSIGSPSPSVASHLESTQCRGCCLRRVKLSNVHMPEAN